MSTRDPLAFEVSVAKFMQMKEQMAKMMCMMQQLVVGRNRDSSSHTIKGFALGFENETQLPPDPNQGQTTPPFVPQGGDQELNPPKDKTSEFGYGQVKSSVEILTEKIHNIEGSSARGNVDLDGLTNFP